MPLDWHGFRQTPSRDTRSVIEEVMHLMKRYLDETIGVGHYGRTMEDVLDSEPLDDKRAQKILQSAYVDFMRTDSPAPQDYQGSSIEEAEFRMRLTKYLADLESLGYLANAHADQGKKL